VHLPGSSSAFIGLPHHSIGSASRLSPRIRFSTGRLSRLQLFHYVQASKFARLPDRSYRSKFPCRAAEVLYIRAERASLPSHASDILSARLQAIGGTRTFTSQDSQPCRLLTNDADVSIALPKITYGGFSILTAARAAHAPVLELDSCHDDLDRLRRTASDASDSAEDAKSKFDEFEGLQARP
jgi:hypothetical protein